MLAIWPSLTNMILDGWRAIVCTIAGLLANGDGYHGPAHDAPQWLLSGCNHEAAGCSRSLSAPVGY